MADLLTLQNKQGIVKSFEVDNAQLRESLSFYDSDRCKVVLPFTSILSMQIKHEVSSTPSGTVRYFTFQEFADFLTTTDG